MRKTARSNVTVKLSSFKVYNSTSSQAPQVISKMFQKYLGLSTEEFDALTLRYNKFQDACNDVTKDPVKVYSAISEKARAELLLNREVSVDLQKKKEEDMKKQAQAAKEMEEKSEETSEQKSEETTKEIEEKTQETEK